jgi:hypothetical protein
VAQEGAAPCRTEGPVRVLTRHPNGDPSESDEENLERPSANVMTVMNAWNYFIRYCIS